MERWSRELEGLQDSPAHALPSLIQEQKFLNTLCKAEQCGAPQGSAGDPPVLLSVSNPIQEMCWGSGIHIPAQGTIWPIGTFPLSPFQCTRR